VLNASSAQEIQIGRDVNPQAAIVQPDFARSNDPTKPTTYSVLSTGAFADKKAGDVGSTIRIDNMSTQRSQIQE
jgi:hypothetical protein